MPVIFNSITRFVEQIGRRSVQAKKNALDQMSCVFIGPTALALAFLPRNGTPHSEFPLMLCETAQITTKEALNAEVMVSYIGKLNAASSNGVVITDPTISPSRHLGSISWTTSYSTSPTQVATTSFTMRYTAKGVTFKYLTNRRPAPESEGNFVAQAQPYLGTENVQRFQTGLSYATGAPSFSPALGYGGYVVSNLVWQNDLTDLQVNDLDNGWFECSEVYMTQPYINSSIA